MGSGRRLLPGCGSSSGCSRPPRPGGQTTGTEGDGGRTRAARSGTGAGAGNAERWERWWQRRRRATLGGGGPGWRGWEAGATTAVLQGEERGCRQTQRPARRGRRRLGREQCTHTCVACTPEVRKNRPRPRARSPGPAAFGLPLRTARTGCAWTELAHSEPAQTYPGLSGPLRRVPRRSPPPPPRCSGPSPPPAAAGTPRGTRRSPPQGFRRC